MKTLFFFFLFLIFSSLSFAQPNFDGGAGTETNPFIMTSIQHFDELNSIINLQSDWTGEIYLKLMNSITRPTITQISNWNRNFTLGNFDGNNNNFNEIWLDIDYSIQPTLTYLEAVNIGLFRGILGVHDNSSTLFSTLKNISVYGKVQGRQTIGGIGGFAEHCKIQNCTNYASVFACGRREIFFEAMGFSVGGILGYAKWNCFIDNCMNFGDINKELCETNWWYGLDVIYFSGDSASNCGGIIGRSHCLGDDFSIFPFLNNCFNVGTVYGEGYVHGMAEGHIDSIINMTNISNLFSTWVPAPHWLGLFGWVAGIISQMGSGVSSQQRIIGCLNTGAITGYSRVSGIIGDVAYFVQSLSVANNTNCGTITGTIFVSGILVSPYNTVTPITLNNNINIGVINPVGDFSNIGCISTSITNNISFRNCFWDKQMCPW